LAILHNPRSARAAPVAVIPLGRHQFPVPSQQRVRRDQGFKPAQHLAPEYLGFSGESTAFGIGETKTLPAHALLQHAVLFLEILDGRGRSSGNIAAKYIGPSETLPHSAAPYLKWHRLVHAPLFSGL
jgi:hypothetical protein